MKAKEMAVIINAAVTEDEKRVAIEKVFLQLNADMTDMMKIRKISTNAGMIGALKETDQKWQAVAKLCPILIDRHGFKKVWAMKVPEAIIMAFPDWSRQMSGAKVNQVFEVAGQVIR